MIRVYPVPREAKYPETTTIEPWYGVYRKILHRPITITAILLLLTSFLSLRTSQGLVLGEFTDLDYLQQFNNLTIQQLTIPAALPKFVNTKQIPENITAKAFIILDPTTHTTFLAQNADQQLPPASLTKIATATVVLQNMDLEQVATVPENISEKAQGSLMGLVPGEKITVENLLWGMLLASGNDAAHTLAVNFPGGYNTFVEEMNNLAGFLHLRNTHFTNVMGFDDGNHFSSAYDLAVLTSYALRKPLFAQMVSTIEKTVVSELFLPTNEEKERQQWHELRNTNELLGRIEGVTGVKTGYTQNASECMVVSLARNNKTIIIVLLGSDKRIPDAEILINWVE